MFGIDRQDFSERTALIENDENISYKQLLKISSDIVKDIPERELVFILTSNTTASVAGYIGCLNSKAVPLLIDSKLSPELITELVVKYRPSYIWVAEGKAGIFK